MDTKLQELSSIRLQDGSSGQTGKTESSALQQIQTVINQVKPIESLEVREFTIGGKENRLSQPLVSEDQTAVFAYCDQSPKPKERGEATIFASRLQIDRHALDKDILKHFQKPQSSAR